MSLTELRLGFNGIEDRGASELYDCLELNTTLTVLHLAGNTIGPVKREIAHRIQRNKRMHPKPERTYNRYCHISVEGLSEQRFNERDPVLLEAMTALTFLVNDEGRY
jgi:Leucine-rich repeat (LRR) protein